MDLYTKEGLASLEKEKKNVLIVFLILQGIAWLSFVLGLVLSNYHTQLVFKIVISIVFTVLFILSAVIFSKWYYLKKLVHEYGILFERSNEIKYHTVINEVKNDIITLPDGSRVREVICNIKDEKRRFVISEIFDDVLPTNKEITIAVKFDYVVGYNDAK